MNTRTALKDLVEEPQPLGIDRQAYQQAIKTLADPDSLEAAANAVLLKYGVISPEWDALRQALSARGIQA